MFIIGDEKKSSDQQQQSLVQIIISTLQLMKDKHFLLMALLCFYNGIGKRYINLTC